MKQPLNHPWKNDPFGKKDPKNAKNFRGKISRKDTVFLDEMEKSRINRIA